MRSGFSPKTAKINVSLLVMAVVGWVISTGAHASDTKSSICGAMFLPELPESAFDSRAVSPEVQSALRDGFGVELRRLARSRVGWGEEAVVDVAVAFGGANGTTIGALTSSVETILRSFQGNRMMAEPRIHPMLRRGRHLVSPGFLVQFRFHLGSGDSGMSNLREIGESLRRMLRENPGTTLRHLDVQSLGSETESTARESVDSLSAEMTPYVETSDGQMLVSSETGLSWAHAIEASERARQEDGDSRTESIPLAIDSPQIVPSQSERRVQMTAPEFLTLSQTELSRLLSNQSRAHEELISFLSERREVPRTVAITRWGSAEYVLVGRGDVMNGHPDFIKDLIEQILETLDLGEGSQSVREYRVNRAEASRRIRRALEIARRGLADEGNVVRTNEVEIRRVSYHRQVLGYSVRKPAVVDARDGTVFAVVIPRTVASEIPLDLRGNTTENRLELEPSFEPSAESNTGSTSESTVEVAQVEAPVREELSIEDRALFSLDAIYGDVPEKRFELLNRDGVRLSEIEPLLESQEFLERFVEYSGVELETLELWLEMSGPEGPNTPLIRFGNRLKARLLERQSIEIEIDVELEPAIGQTASSVTNRAESEASLSRVENSREVTRIIDQLRRDGVDLLEIERRVHFSANAIRVFKRRDATILRDAAKRIRAALAGARPFSVAPWGSIHVERYTLNETFSIYFVRRGDRLAIVTFGESADISADGRERLDLAREAMELLED